MTRWKFTLDLENVWRKPEESVGFTYKHLAEEIAKQIKALPCYATDTKLQDICTEFEYFDDEGDADELDFIMSDLYDWGDDEHKCWIKTE